MTVVKENGFNCYSNSHRYPGSNRDDMLPVASTSDESRYINDRIDNLRKPGGSVAALKELVSCFLNYKLLDNQALLTKGCYGTLQCTVEGYNLVFLSQPSTDGSAGKEVGAQVSTSGWNDHVACLVYLDIVRSISESRPATI